MPYSSRRLGAGKHLVVLPQREPVRGEYRVDVVAVGVTARIARHGRGHITLHLPEGWHHQTEWMSLFEAACGPPAAMA